MKKMQENILKMHRLALVGCNISHSRSPEIYRNLISPDIVYDLLDFKKEKEIPSLEELFKNYDGINITSPYKKHFLKEVNLSLVAKKTGSINCLKKINNEVYGENTDYFAIRDILLNLIKEKGPLEIGILGDGVMSQVLSEVLKELGSDFLLFSRKKTKDFSQLNLKKYFSENLRQLLIINTCAREYIFSGELPSKAIFWDFNYDLPTLHLKNLMQNEYVDGRDLLLRQASYALTFWSDSKP